MTTNSFLSTKLDQIVQDIEELEASSARRDKDSDELRRQLQQKDENTKAWLKSKLKEVKEAIEELQGVRAVNEQSERDYKQTIHRQKEDIRDLSARVRDQNRQFDELRASRDEEVARLKAEVKVHAMQVKELSLVRHTYNQLGMPLDENPSFVRE
ncbi:hypothetical protein MD484_g8700, partial [Candolleomyces efflorescens]